MLWHNGINWKKYLARRDRQREAYRQAGMTEAQIAAIEEFDEEVFRSDRRFYAHSCPHHDEEDPERVPCPVAPAEDGVPAGVRFDWLEEIGDPDLLALLRLLTPEELRRVDLLVFRGYSQRELARLRGCTPQQINMEWQRFRKKAADFLLAQTQRRKSAGQEQGAEEEEPALQAVREAGSDGQLRDQEAEALQRWVQLLRESAWRVGPGAGGAADAAFVGEKQEVGDAGRPEGGVQPVDLPLEVPVGSAHGLEVPAVLQGVGPGQEEKAAEGKAPGAARLQRPHRRGTGPAAAVIPAPVAPADLPDLGPEA